MPRYAIVIEKEAGSTIEEVKRLMEEGISFHLNGMREDGLTIPEPTTEGAYADVVWD